MGNIRDFAREENFFVVLELHSIFLDDLAGSVWDAAHEKGGATSCYATTMSRHAQSDLTNDIRRLGLLLSDRY